MKKISGDEPICDEVGYCNNDVYCDGHNQYDINNWTSILSEEGSKQVTMLRLLLPKLLV